MAKTDDVLAEVLPPRHEGAEVVPICNDTNIRQVKQRHTFFTDDRKQTFLDAMEQHGDKTLAAAKAGVHVRTVNGHLRSDAEFLRLYEEAYDTFKGNLEALALQRSQVSDRVLELVLKRHIPEYRERVQVDQRTQVLPPPEHVDVSKLGPEQREALKTLLGVADTQGTQTEQQAPDLGVPEALQMHEDRPG